MFKRLAVRILIFVFASTLINVYLVRNVNNLQVHVPTDTAPLEKNVPKISFKASRNISQFWSLVDSLVETDTLYPENFDVDVMLDKLRSVKIIGVERFKARTSYKWMLTLDGGRKAIFKPQIVSPDHRFGGCFDGGCEHPEYEIAAFALNRVLGLRNMPYTTGRILSWWDDVLPVASKDLQESVSAPGELENRTICSEWTCLYENHPTKFCFPGGLVPGAIIYYLPDTVKIFMDGKSEYHSYTPRRLPSSKDLNRLPGDNTFCQEFTEGSNLYSQKNWFADVLDTSVVDFLMSHLDSRHYYIERGGQPAMNVMIDYGRAFCTYEPALKILAPVTQCCRIRRRALENLLRHKSNFSSQIVKLTHKDPLHPVLSYDLLEKMDSRNQQLLGLMDFCFALKNITRVLIDL